MNKKYLNLYVAFLREFLDVRRPIKIVFDCSNGAAGLVLKKLLKPRKTSEALRGQNVHKIKAIYINDRPDGSFPAHDPNPLKPGSLTELRRAVKKHKADLGVIFDADGDRAFFVDDKGSQIQPHIIARLLFMAAKPPFVAEIITFEALKYSGLIKQGEVLVSKVGTYFIKEKMIEKKANVGAEYSGHYYFKELFYNDSGILAAIRIINAISKMPYKFSKFVELMPQKITLNHYNIRARNPLKFLKEAEGKYRKRALSINKIDGLTFEFKNNWFIIRPSNTEPLVRFFAGKTRKTQKTQKTRKN